jgi:hypothetical protein
MNKEETQPNKYVYRKTDHGYVFQGSNDSDSAACSSVSPPSSLRVFGSDEPSIEPSQKRRTKLDPELEAIANEVLANELRADATDYKPVVKAGTIKESGEKEGMKQALKNITKKVAKAAANEVIQEIPGPPGHLIRIIKSEVDKSNRQAKKKQLANDIMRTIGGSGDYWVGKAKYRETGPRYPTNGVRRGTSRISGSGDYAVHSNSISMRSRVAADVDLVPSFKGANRETRVMHREYLGDVISSSVSGAFTNTTYKLNPGIVTSFPWLSVIAQNFDQWRPNGVVVCFKSTSAIYNGTNQALGTVIIASDYDLTDAAYSSKIEMENSEFAVSAKASDSILHPVECNVNERQVKVLKCRGVTNPSDNLQWYDLCNVQVASQGISGTSVTLGELWVTYDISFFKEQLYGNLFGNSILAAEGTGTTGITTSAYFGSNFALTSTSTLSLTFTGTTITFPTNVSAGAYFVNMSWVGDSTAFTVPSVAYTTNCSAGPAIFASATSIGSTGTGIIMFLQFAVTLSGPSAVLTLSGGTIPTNPTALRFYATQINSSVF